ncbi:MAG: class I SAM-dependent methyltransferase [Micromonosporaceae bacterium]
MDRDSWDAQRSSFGTAAALYDKVRPRYHSDALRWALECIGRTQRVIDLGAGTGILSGQLIASGFETVPVEPDPGMRDQCDVKLRELFGAAAGPALAGSAEDIPVPDGGADAVIAGQAYHWFDPAKAHPEIARVLSRGGVFAPIWNIRDENEPWVAELTTVLHSQDGTGVHAGWSNVDLGDHFTGTERATFRHAVRHTPDSLRDLLRSRSYYLTGDEGRRATLERELGDLLTTHPDLTGRDEFDLPYVTVAYRARRR